jgi:hypothetical protein
VTSCGSEEVLVVRNPGTAIAVLIALAMVMLRFVPLVA